MKNTKYFFAKNMLIRHANAIVKIMIINIMMKKDKKLRKNIKKTKYVKNVKNFFVVSMNAWWMMIWCVIVLWQIYRARMQYILALRNRRLYNQINKKNLNGILIGKDKIIIIKWYNLSIHDKLNQNFLFFKKCYVIYMSFFL